MINENEIRRTLSLLKPDGHLFEVRVIYNSKAVYSGYFKSADDLMAALSRDIRDYANCNIYITLNYLNDECYSRSQRNRFMSKGLATTSDKDVLGYEWIFIDVDPHRTTAVSSSDEQIEKAKEIGNKVSHDTVGIVNDQAGSTYREMVQFPNGKTIIPRGRNVMLPMPKGTKVLPADQTASLMNMPHFKKGIGDFFGGAWAKFKDFTGNIADYISNPKKLVQMAIDKFTDFSSYLEPGLSMAKNAVRGTVGIATKFIKDKLKGFGGSGSGVNYKPSAGVEQWRATAKKALELTNQFTEANLNRLLMQMKSESGGNPNAINNWDINAKMGIPSKGLMQVIDPTFRAYAMKGFDKNIYDPMSNILAAIRYTLARYGSLERGWKGHGYANGGFPKVGEMFYARESGPELVGKIGNRSAVVNNQQIVDSVSNGVSRANDETNSLLRTIIEYQELLLKKETSVNMDGKRMDKQISKARRNTGFSFSPT